MRCPYQKRVIHKPEDTLGYMKHFAEDITVFADCLKCECPFYYKKNTDHCRRAEREEKNEATK